MVRFIVKVLTGTGEIYDITTPPGEIREDLQEGIVADSDPEIEIFHILTGDVTFQELQSWEILQRYYRESNTWAFRGDPPTGYHEWNTDSNTWILNLEKMWSYIRTSRTLKLQGSDWTQLPDARLTAVSKSAWATYRQQLRDITITNADVTDPEDIAWPTPPE